MPASPIHAQWVPTGTLGGVPIVRDCDTRGDVAVSTLEPPVVHLCPATMRFIARRHPGAEHFYFVHEFGHIALHTANEADADCWAARALARARHGRRFLAAAIAHFRDRPDENRIGYGTPIERAERIGRCADAAMAPASADDEPEIR